MGNKYVDEYYEERKKLDDCIIRLPDEDEFVCSLIVADVEESDASEPIDFNKGVRFPFFKRDYCGRVEDVIEAIYNRKGFAEKVASGIIIKDNKKKHAEMIMKVIKNVMEKK